VSGRENQYGLYISDRWNASDKLTLNLGLRYEYYPLMTRADRGIERLDYDTWEVLLGGVGNVPEDLGIKVSKTLFAPRLGLAYRINDKTVFRTGYGVTNNPLPWSRPLRGFYPLTIGFSTSATGSDFTSIPLEAGIPEIPLPDISSGRIPLPRGVTTRTPNPADVERSRIQQWNVTLERQIPLDVSVSLAYVGTRTDGGYADQNLNYSEGGGDVNRQFFTQAGTADVLDWAARTRSRYHGLQMAINRPFNNGLLLKGAYTWSKAMNETDEDGWATLTWSQPSQLHRNYAKAGYDRTHVFQMGFVYELPYKQQPSVVGRILGDWQVNGVFSAFSGTPFGIGGDNTALGQRQGSQTIEQIGEIRRVGDPGPDDVYFDPAAFAQPGNKWGNTGRNFLRGPSQWNLDMSLFKSIPFGGNRRAEIRLESTNILNHTRWNNPVTGFTDPNFMRIRSAGDPRRIQIGFRFQF
jgi:hypothetical protein